MAQHFPNGVRPINKVITKPKPPTEEEALMNRMKFFATRREQFAVSILTSLVRGNGFAYPKDQDNFLSLADLSVEMADRLLEKLYPAPKPEEKK